METTKSERIRLGIFLMISIALVLCIVGFFVGQQLLAKHTPYYTRFTESVNGLNPGAKVRWNGVEVGKVTKLEVDQQNLNAVIVHFEVQPGTPIKSSVQANMVGAFSLTGLKTIELTGGQQNDPNLPGGAFVQAGTSQLKQLTGQAETIVFKTESLMNNLLSITSDENLANLAGMLRHFNHLSGQLDSLVTINRAVLDSLPRNSRQSLKQLDLATNAAKLLLDSIQYAVNAINPRGLGKSAQLTLDAFQKSANDLDHKIQDAEISKTLGSFQKAAGQVESTTKHTDQILNRSQEDIAASLKNMKEASENLADFAREIRANPSLLMRSEKKQDRER